MWQFYVSGVLDVGFIMSRSRGNRRFQPENITEILNNQIAEKHRREAELLAENKKEILRHYEEYQFGKADTKQEAIAERDLGLMIERLRQESGPYHKQPSLVSKLPQIQNKDFPRPTQYKENLKQNLFSGGGNTLPFVLNRESSARTEKPPPFVRMTGLVPQSGQALDLAQVPEPPRKSELEVLHELGDRKFGRTKLKPIGGTLSNGQGESSMLTRDAVWEAKRNRIFNRSTESVVEQPPPRLEQDSPRLSPPPTKLDPRPVTPPHVSDVPSDVPPSVTEKPLGKNVFMPPIPLPSAVEQRRIEIQREMREHVGGERKDRRKQALNISDGPRPDQEGGGLFAGLGVSGANLRQRVREQVEALEPPRTQRAELSPKSKLRKQMELQSPRVELNISERDNRPPRIPQNREQIVAPLRYFHQYTVYGMLLIYSATALPQSPWSVSVRGRARYLGALVSVTDWTDS
jgi:hypothetical protein